jgi:hypothetical protein
MIWLVRASSLAGPVKRREWRQGRQGRRIDGDMEDPDDFSFIWSGMPGNIQLGYRARLRRMRWLRAREGRIDSRL